MAKFKIKRDDTVKVLAGKDKGKVGRVLEVDKRRDRVVVEGVAQVRRHQKPTNEREGGILVKEAAIHVSNVCLWNVDDNRRVKVGFSTNEAGKKVRIDRATGALLD